MKYGTQSVFDSVIDLFSRVRFGETAAETIPRLVLPFDTDFFPVTTFEEVFQCPLRCIVVQYVAPFGVHYDFTNKSRPD